MDRARQRAGAEPGRHGQVSRLRRHDPEAAEVLVRSSRRRLLAVVRRYLRHEQDAEDTVQDAFLHALRALPRFRGGSSFSTWLHRIAINLAILKLRQRNRRTEIELGTLAAGGRGVLALTEAAASLETQLIEADARSRIQAGIMALPPQEREVVTLMDIEGMSTREVANLLGVTPNAIKLRLMRARRRLPGQVAPLFQVPVSLTRADRPRRQRPS